MLSHGYGLAKPAWYGKAIGSAKKLVVNGQI